ncbi:nucleotidyltransferase family protein [Parabacteroides sp.]
MECIILAGGMGTRLQSVVSDVPKCMAPVAGQPFLYYLLTTLAEAGFKHIILSLGYKHEVIESWFQVNSFPVDISSVTETSPLGTGGAVKLALSKARTEEVFILNGDTFFGVNYPEMMRLHQATQSVATVALKKMEKFDRYGVVDIEPATSRILRFNEKQYCEKGLINGGIYLLNRHELDNFPDKFSLEKDFFETAVHTSTLSGYLSDGYFIDIGIPEDYAQAQTDFKDGKYKAV